MGRESDESAVMNRVDNILATIDLMTLIPADFVRSVGIDRWRGRCPIGDHATGAFAVNRHADGHLVFQCFSCHKRGSAIDLFAELNNLSVGDAIRKMSAGKAEVLSSDAIFQRSLDSWNRNQPQWAWLICDDCGEMEKLNSGLDFAILCALGSWQWGVCSDGSARCIKCRKSN